MPASTTTSPLDPARATATEAPASVVPLIAETLHVGIDTQAVGAVRVRVEVEHARQRVDAGRVVEEYQPTVRPVGTPAGERRDPYLDGDDVVIPVYEERMVVERRLFLKEEVRLRRVRHVDPRQSEVEVRRDRPVFERRQPDGTWRELPLPPGAPVADDVASPSSRTPPE